MTMSNVYFTKHFGISFDGLDFIKGKSSMRNQDFFGVHFLSNLAIDLDGIEDVATTIWFVEGDARHFAQVVFKGEKTKTFNLV